MMKCSLVLVCCFFSVLFVCFVCFAQQLATEIKIIFHSDSFLFLLGSLFLREKGEATMGRRERCSLMKSLFQCESYTVLSMLLVKCIALTCTSTCGVQKSSSNKQCLIEPDCWGILQQQRSIRDNTEVANLPYLLIAMK